MIVEYCPLTKLNGGYTLQMKMLFLGWHSYVSRHTYEEGRKECGGDDVVLSANWQESFLLSRQFGSRMFHICHVSSMIYFSVSIFQHDLHELSAQQQRRLVSADEVSAVSWNSCQYTGRSSALAICLSASEQQALPVQTLHRGIHFCRGVDLTVLHTQVDSSVTFLSSTNCSAEWRWRPR